MSPLLSQEDVKKLREDWDRGDVLRAGQAASNWELSVPTLLARAELSSEPETLTHDVSRPIRGQCVGHVICLGQSAATPSHTRSGVT